MTSIGHWHFRKMGLILVVEIWPIGNHCFHLWSFSVCDIRYMCSFGWFTCTASRWTSAEAGADLGGVRWVRTNPPFCWFIQLTGSLLLPAVFDTQRWHASPVWLLYNLLRAIQFSEVICSIFLRVELASAWIGVACMHDRLEGGAAGCFCSWITTTRVNVKVSFNANYEES